jgi:hypothetical protein
LSQRGRGVKLTLTRVRSILQYAGSTERAKATSNPAASPS